jgi:protein subunit release factor A
MLEKLEAIKKKWKEIEQKMNEPSAMANMKLFIKLNKDYTRLAGYINKKRYPASQKT